MKFIGNGFNRYDALYVLVATLLVILYVMTANGGFPLDDSWIHQVYGRNLAETGRWEFVRGVPSAGSTSPLYTILLSIGYLLRIDYKIWTHLLGIIALSAAGMIGSRLAASMGKKLVPNAKWLPVMAGLSLVGSWHLVWAAVSGMETMMICTFTLALLWAAWQEADSETIEEKLEPAVISDDAKPTSDNPRSSFMRGIVFGVLTALTAATRPEVVLLAGIIGIAIFVIRIHRWRSFLTWGVGAALGFAVFITPYFILNYQLTGGLLPTTAAAKQASIIPAIEFYSFPVRFGQMFYPLIAGGQMLLALGMVTLILVALWRIRQQRIWVFYLVPLIWAITDLSLYAARLPAGGQHGRYVMPVLPGMILIGVLGTFWLLRQGRAVLWARAFTRALAITSILLFAYCAIIIGPDAYRVDVSIIDQEQVASALWIRDNLPADQLLAIHDIGAVGYFAPRNIIDVAGLVSPEIIPIILEPDAVWELLRQRDARYLMAFPDQIPGDDEHDPHLCPLHRSGGTASPEIGGPSMVVYALTWNEVCP
jgi:hypothetical protein